MVITTPIIWKGYWEVIIAYIIFYEFVLGSTYVLAMGMLFLVELAQPLVPLFNQIYTKTIEMPL
jgi:hypothetical protein